MKEAIEAIIERLDLLDDWAEPWERSPIKLIVADIPIDNPKYHQSQRFNYSGQRGVRY